MKRTSGPPSQRGFSMIEVLVTMVVVAFGLLGLASFVSRATVLGVEASQRARAATLLADMGNRIATNRPGAASYVSNTALGTSVDTGCAAKATLALRDLCEWNNLLAGRSDALTSGTANALTFVGCVTKPAASDEVYVVTVAWASNMPGVPPVDGCGQGTLSDDSFRRIVRTQVRVPALSA